MCHHLPIGQLACFNVDFSFIKHPHLVHLASLLLKAGQVLQIESLSSISFLSDLGCDGSKRSVNSTSPLSFILLFYHTTLDLISDMSTSRILDFAKSLYLSFRLFKNPNLSDPTISVVSLAIF